MVNYDDNGHLGFLRCYKRIASSYYIRNHTSHLKAFLKHCASCNINQTHQHPTYGNLQHILSSSIPFHSVTMNFILALSLSRNGKDNLITVSCKFAKRILLILGHLKWRAAEWALALLKQLEVAELGLPKVIISDWVKKFLSALWTSWFQRLRVKLL